MFDLRGTGLKLIVALSISFVACVCLTASGLLLFQQARTLALSSTSGLRVPRTAAPVTPMALFLAPTLASKLTIPTAVPAIAQPAIVAAPAPVVSTPLTAGARPAAWMPTMEAPDTSAVPATPIAIRDGSEIPVSAAGRLAAPETRPQTFNVVLLGTDRNETGKGTWRTDVMALVALQPDSHTAGVLAIPRDLWVNIPDHEPDRINTVDFLGHYTQYPGDGQALLNQTLHQNFGFGFDRYIRIDFNGFAQVVDELGGIDVDVDCPLEERFADPAVPEGRLLKVSAGMQHMDGNTALLYVRQRHDNGDTDRSRRQFKVLMALREKSLKLDTLPLLPKLWTTYRANVQTDLSLPEMLQLARWMADFKSENLHGRIIDQTLADPWTTPKGAWVLLPHTDQIQAAFADLLVAPSIIEAGHRTRCPK
jgi:polyisoprenyl-teichoic acid--peptidoglycan teichoic acid transferase